MKKLFGMVMMACMLSACGNSIQDSNEQGSLELAGYAQENLVIRNLNIPTENGMLNVRCYVDEAETEVCKGTFEDGNAANEEQLQSAMSITHPNTHIDEALKDGCENKTLLVSLSFKYYESAMFLPCHHIDNSTMECDGEIVSFEEAERRNNDYRKAWFGNLNQARNAMLDQFIKLNPDLVSEEIEANYRENDFSSLALKMPACDYKSFISKNSPLLDSIKFRGLVADQIPEVCDSPLDYKVLLNNREFWMEQCNETPTYTALNSQEDLNNYLKDADDYLKQYIQSSKLNEIDFEHSTVLVLFGGSYGSTAYPLNVETVCKDAPINVYIDHCVGKPEDTSMSCPLMILQAPKGEYNVNFVPRDLVCE